MRKFFAAALAAAMTLSMSAVSFADATYSKTAAVELKGPYRYHADSNTMRSSADGDVMRYGEGTYYLLGIKDDTSDTAPAGAGVDLGAFSTDFEPVQTYKNVEKLKIKAEFEMGEDLVESVSLVKKYVEASKDIFTNGALKGESAGYYYFVEFKVASKQTTSDADIVGTLEFNRKADKDVKGSNYDEGVTEGIGKIKDDEIDFEFNVFYADTWIADSDTYTVGVKSDEVDLKYDTNYALKFECDEEVELNFGDADHDGTNEGTFTVDVSGQGKVFLKYNTKANEAIAAANPGVKMHFVNFNNVKFNRVGEFVYEMDDIVAAYKIVNDKLVEIKGVELDGDSATFYTRLLESYVFADAELVNPVVEAPVVEAPVVEAPVVTNPSTGANA